jgi:hypothetical protein
VVASLEHLMPSSEFQQLLHRYPRELQFLTAVLNHRLTAPGQPISLQDVAAMFWQDEMQALLETGFFVRQTLAELMDRYQLDTEQLLEFAEQDLKIAVDLAQAALTYLPLPDAPRASQAG